MTRKAERVGFEPTRRLNTAYAISSRAPSANSDTSPEDTEKVYQILAVTRSDRPVVPQPRGDMLPRMAERRPIRKRNEVRTVWWEPDAVCLIDQTRLPHIRDIVRCESVEAVASAIREMVVRGAPAIGVTAAYGMALAAQESTAPNRLARRPRRGQGEARRRAPHRRQPELGDRPRAAGGASDRSWGSGTGDRRTIARPGARHSGGRRAYVPPDRRARRGAVTAPRADFDALQRRGTGYYGLRHWRR